VWIPKENAYLVVFEWTDDEQAKLNIQVESHTSLGVSGAQRVHRRWLACFSLLSEDMKDYNNVTGKWYD
jgi:hypothetical protein